jgi:hypothetical protein
MRLMSVSAYWKYSYTRVLAPGIGMAPLSRPVSCGRDVSSAPRCGARCTHDLVVDEQRAVVEGRVRLLVGAVGERRGAELQAEAHVRRREGRLEGPDAVERLRQSECQCVRRQQ